MPDDADHRLLAAAIRLGAGAQGTTWPNPAVGAIVVKDGIVVGRGRTARGGRPHAEPLALAQAGPMARGATLYVSLEPCSHAGRGPPCADAIIAADIARVVSSRADPDPRVAGSGFARLEAAGVGVVAGLLSAEARRAHAGHLGRVERRVPHVTLKLAVSADEAVGRAGEGQVPVTGPAARRHVQALRSRFDAIAVGARTLIADDPLLTSRLPGLEDRSPVRVLFSPDGEFDASRRAFNSDAPSWLLAPAPDAQLGHVRRLSIPLLAVGRLDLRAGLARLAAEGITRLLLEGGARLARAFMEADLVDAVVLFRAPAALGGAIVPALAGLPLAAIEASERFHKIDARWFGPDRMTRYERVW